MPEKHIYKTNIETTSEEVYGGENSAPRELKGYTCIGFWPPKKGEMFLSKAFLLQIPYEAALDFPNTDPRFIYRKDETAEDFDAFDEFFGPEKNFETDDWIYYKGKMLDVGDVKLCRGQLVFKGR